MKVFDGLTGGNSRKLTLVLFATGGVLLSAAFVVGISDNWLGILLCYGAAAAVILAFAHGWRGLRRFLVLLGASLVGFPVCVVLHNLFYGLGELAAGIIILSPLLEFLHAVFFLIAVLVCPAGFLIGAVGSIVIGIKYFKKRLRDKQE